MSSPAVPLTRTCASSVVAMVLSLGGGGLCASQQEPATVAQPAPSDGTAPLPAAPERPPFDVWLAQVRQEAIARGIGSRTIEAAFDGLEPLPVVVERDQSQAEFTLSLDAYLKRRLTRQTVRLGTTSYARHRALLRRVESAYGVDPATIVSIWGIESNFGRFSGVRPTVAAVATLAYEPRRATLFREEVFAALTILDRGDIDLAEMKGSWAGAMGQPQFLPSSYLKYAVDFDKDGHRNIWSSTADIFASVANYLKAHGWSHGQRWGRRVRVPVESPRFEAAIVQRPTGCRALRQLSAPLPLREWSTLGVRLPTGKQLPASTQAASLLRMDGDTFLIYTNYEAILGYNCAHPYALSVAMLADRIAGR